MPSTSDLAAAVEVVELRLGDAVVDVDGGPQQRALLLHLVEPVHARGGLLGDALDGLGELAEPALGLLLQRLLEEREQDLLFLGAGLVQELHVAALGAHAQVHEQRGVAAVVEDHVRHAAVAPLEQAQRVVPIVLEALALDGEYGGAAGGDRGRGVVLGRIDVAGDPAHVGAERRQGLDQHRGLDGHVQRAGDARALQRLGLAELLARRHQARHLGLGDGDFLAAELGQADVLHHVVATTRHWHKSPASCCQEPPVALQHKEAAKRGPLQCQADRGKAGLL